MDPVPRVYETLLVSLSGSICTVTMNRPAAGNTINGALIRELSEVVSLCEDEGRETPITVLVLRGQPTAFCTGGDLEAMVEAGLTDPDTDTDTDSAGGHHSGGPSIADPAPLYDLWLRLSTGPFVYLCVVQGRVNAGGVGFVAAADLALADPSAELSLSELLFGLLPACVYPFLSRRVGAQRAHRLTLSTRPISAAEALQWSLLDAVEDNVELALRRQLVSLRRLSRAGLRRYKSFRAGLHGSPEADREAALAANRAMFSDPKVRQDIRRYVTEGRFPWEP